MQSIKVLSIPLLAVLLLAACGSGSATQAPTPDVAATVAAQVQATTQALAASSQPSVVSPQPSVVSPQPSVVSPQPSVVSPQPSVVSPQPSAVSPQPSVVSPQPSAVSPQPSAVSPQPSAVSPQPSVVSPVAAGVAGEPLLIAVSRNGRLGVLNASGWITAQINEQFGDTCGDRSASVGLDASGTLWAVCGATLTSADGSVWDRPAQRLYASRIFIDPRGRVWAPLSDTLEVLDGTQVQKYIAAAVTGEERFPGSTMAFAADGTAWLAGYNSKGSQLVSFDGTTWKTYGSALGLPNDSMPDALLVTSQGQLLAAASNAVYRFDGARFSPFIPRTAFATALGSNNFYGQVRKLLELPDGSLWMATDNGIFNWDGAKLSLIDRAAGLPSSDVRDIVLDAQGRIWVATAHGIALRAGSEWQVAVPSTSGLPDSDIQAIMVRGAPVLPPASEARTTVVSGRVVQANKPLAQAEVELCSEPPQRTGRGDSPCAGQFFSQRVTTDAQGMYRIENVPLGSYGVAIRDTQGRWYVPSRLSILALEAGTEVTEDVDLGK